MSAPPSCFVCGLPPPMGVVTPESRCASCGILLPGAGSPDKHLQDVALLAERGEKINAIKLYRGLTGEGLKEAKDAVERIAEGKEPQPSPSALERMTKAPSREFAEMERLILAGQKIQAIKLHREVTRSGLKEAKDAMDALEEKLRSTGAMASRGPAHLQNENAPGNRARLLLMAFVALLAVAFLGLLLARKS